MILRSNSVTPHPVKVGDLFQVYYKIEKEKRGRWLPPRLFLEIDQQAGLVNVPGARGRTVNATLEDVRVADDSDDWAKLVIDAIDEISDSIGDMIEIVTHLDPDPDPAPDTAFKTQTDTSYTDTLADPTKPQVGDHVEIL